eukprot:4671272-Amphidinium_carterae.1
MQSNTRRGQHSGGRQLSLLSACQAGQWCTICTRTSTLLHSAHKGHQRSVRSSGTSTESRGWNTRGCKEDQPSWQPNKVTKNAIEEDL